MDKKSMFNFLLQNNKKRKGKYSSIEGKIHLIDTQNQTISVDIKDISGEHSKVFTYKEFILSYIHDGLYIKNINVIKKYEDILEVLSYLYLKSIQGGYSTEFFYTNDFNTIYDKIHNSNYNLSKPILDSGNSYIGGVNDNKLKVPDFFKNK